MANQTYPYTTNEGRKIKFMYFGDSKRRVAAAYYTMADPETGEKTLFGAFAICNPKDQFSKKIARKIAIGRLEAGKMFETYDTEKPSERQGKIAYIYQMLARINGWPLLMC